MPITELIVFLDKIGAPSVHPGASGDDIKRTEHRLNGRFPDTLRNWYGQADGYDGVAELCMWRFKPLCRVHRVSDCFPSATEFLITTGGQITRRADCSHYAIFLDAFINLPFHAVNIRPESPYFSEVLCAAEETPTDAHVAAASFDLFAQHIFAFPEDPLIFDR